MNKKRSWNWALNPWVISGSIILGILLFIATLLLLWNTRTEPFPGVSSTAIMNVIFAATDTPTPSIPTQELITTQGPSDDTISVGQLIQISGTGGSGLRLRFQAGLSSNVRLLGAEGENFLVMDGPQELDGYTWWYLESPEDRDRRGWAVADYLILTENP